MVFAITEPVFRLITFETESYFILVSNLEEELAMIEDIKGFASTESSPKLLDLVPLLEKIIQLRSLVYSREIEFARALMQDINVSMGEIIKAFFFTDSMQEEMIACEKLLKKMEYEKLLDIALNNHLCKPYDFADENEQLKYTANVSLTAGIVLLQDVLQNLSILSASFDSNLQAKINVGNILLSGRKYLQMDETDVHTPWQDYHKSFESSVEGLKDDENNMYANYEGEFEVILHEMQRRSLLHGCCIILHAIVVDGRVDIDVHVESSVLSDLFHKFNHVILCLKRKYEQYPVNLQNLAKFTKEMLKFRKYLNDFHDKWDLNIVDKILGKLQTMKHGGGMNIENVRREMVLMEKEIDARRNTNQLKHELQFLPLNVSDSSTQVSLLVNSEPLTQAIEKAKPNQGHMSKKLVALAVSVITMLKHLQQNETDKIDINSMEDIATRYQTFQLDVSNINIVFNRVRIYNFLKSLNEALVTHKDKPESLLQIINKVKASLKNLPAKFIPWLHTAYLYCYLSDALHRKSWIEIIEVAQELDEYINSELKETLVSMQQENTAFDNNFSDAEKFLSVCTEYKLHGFYKAIEMKTEQDTSELYKQSVHLSPIDSLKAQIRHDDLCKNMYGVGALRNASYSDAEIAKLNFPPKILWAYNFECSLLRKVNYPANQLLEAGFPLEDLYRSGYKILELYHNGVTISQLLRLGLTVSQLRQAGITNEELLQSQDIPIAEVKDLENEPKKLFKLGYTLPELVQAGFTVSELRGAGFSATEIYHAGLRNVQDFIAAGFSSSRLTAVFPLKQLAASGSLSYSELKYAGVSELDLLQAGFEVDVEKRALMVIYQKLAGARWRYQVHWNSNKPLKQWYGIATQPDARQVERVVSIDLVDNNLQGDLPEELGLFLCLRRLRLSGNARLNLTSIPDPLLKLIQQNKIVNDIIPYNSVNKILSRTMSFNHGYSNLLSPVKTQDPTNTSVNNLSIDIPLSSTPVVKGNNSNVMQALSSVHSMFALNPDENKDGERDALVEIYRALRGQKWKNSANWCSAAPVSSWFGVSVNREGYVIALILPSNNLKGCLPDAVGSLRYLEELDLRLNQISGLIPHGLAYCFSLKKLYLQTNKLSGSIPNGIEELTDLIVLDLRSNSLQGEPPCNALKNLPNLRYLGLYSNLLTVNRQQLLQILPSCKIVL
ncbi:hypothetical protein EON65_02925 [archaeon]|nr:MAG: hypothetical protein EON65_02925 [archaeon]